MNRNVRYALNVGLFLLLIAGATLGVSQALQPRQDILFGPLGEVYDFPPGFDYPQNAQTVQEWVNARQGGRIREHGWNLFAGLNQPVNNGYPVWRTWFTSTQAFDNPGIEEPDPFGPVTLKQKNAANAALQIGGQDPINFADAPFYKIPAGIWVRENGKKVVKPEFESCVAVPQSPPHKGDPEYGSLRDGNIFQSNGDIMLAGVVYNTPAYQNIRANQYYLADRLNSLLPESPNTTANRITPFPKESIVLKPMLWPVKKNGFTALPVFVPNNFWPPTKDASRYAGYERQELWSRAVAVTPGSTAEPGEDVQYLYDALAEAPSKSNPDPRPLRTRKYENAKVVSVNDFYHIKVTKDFLGQINSCDLALLNASATWNFDRFIEEGDYLVLIAMHIMTKEQPVWTFQSAWWTDDPNGQNPWNAARPSDLGNHAVGPWDHYMLTSTYGMLQVVNNDSKNSGLIYPLNEIVDGAMKWPVAYNPYIELAAAHPIGTNCMNCHTRAAWPPRMAVDSTDPNDPDLDRFSSYLAGGENSPDALDAYIATNPIFNGLLLVDAMWAISDRAGGTEIVGEQ